MNRIRSGALAALCRGLVAACTVALAWSACAQTADAPLIEIRRFTVEGENPLSEQETQAILAPHLGRHTSLSTIEAAAIALETVLRERGYSFHRVILPAQRPTEGEVKLQVLQFSLAEVAVTGNRHFSSDNILRSLPGLEPGRPPDLRQLSRQLSLANEHPSKRMTVNIKESQKPNHLDAEVRVTDVPSMQSFLAFTGGTRDVDNTINHNTGYTRLTLGHQQSNLFDLDHALTLTVTTSPDHVSDVMQLGAFYWLPLYGYNTSLSAFWSRSDVDTGTVGVGGQSFSVSGRGEFWGLRATYALPKFGQVSQHASLGFEDRFFKSDIGFQGAPALNPNVGSRPLSLRYLARAEDIDWGIGGYLEYLVNLDGGRANDDTSYNNARAGARRGWDAWRYGLDANRALGGGWNFVGRLRGQYTNDPLIPGEQFGVGGVSTVRGLRERETTGDRGHVLNLEIHAPALSWGISPFVFYDAGERRHVTPIAGIPTSDSVASVGVGARWSWERQLEVSVTLASVLNSVSLGTAPATDSGHTKFNFSLFYRF